jgi:hypothetical protein
LAGFMITNRYEFNDLSELEDYSGLLEQIGRFASVAGFVIDGESSRYSSLAHAVIHEVEGEFVTIETDLDHWPGTTKIVQSDATRYLFHLTPATSRILTHSARSLFEWKNPRLPEDLHFMRADRSVVLGNVAHENYAWLELSAEELELWAAQGRFPAKVGAGEN